MSDWGDLEAVLGCVRHGGLSPAARELGVTHATVARRIAQAEARLGAVLFDRTPGGYVPTDAGLEAAAAAERMEDAVAALDLSIAGRDAGMSGPLVVTAPPVLVEAFLAEMLAAFRADHPGIEITLLATNDPLNLHRREADVAIRVARQPTQTLWGIRAVEQSAGVFVASSALGQPPRWIGFTHWGGVPKSVLAAYPDIPQVLRFDDMVSVLGAVRAGLGAARMPLCLGQSDPGLARLPGTATEPYAPIWLLTHPELRRMPRVAAFIRDIGARMRSRSGLFSETAGK